MGVILEPSMDQLELIETTTHLPPGLLLYPELIDVQEELELLNAISKIEWKEVRMHGVIAKRKVMHYGIDYIYDSRQISRTTPPPEFLSSIINKAAKILRVKPEKLEEVLVSYYPPGAGIGWHRDAPMFGDQVFGISLGGEAIMKFRHEIENGYEVIKVPLPPRAGYVIGGAARWQWQHSIPAVKSARYSVTLRTIRDKHSV
jgi:DNA oxidative demethylase